MIFSGVLAATLFTLFVVPVAYDVLARALGLAVVWYFWRDGLDMSFLMDEELTFGGTLFDPVMVPSFRLAHIGWSVFFILVIGIGSSLYPAHQAARIDVAEAMKFER